jgi:NAD(P)-dependent dehydrogenase (short-subunit alcohol dehydrogenase family)
MKGRTVVITGGRGGLGEAVVAGFTARGATVVVPPREVRVDDEVAVTAFYAGLPSLWASVHVVGGFAMGSITSTTLEQFEQQWRTNVVTCFLSCREAVRAMQKSGGGRIVNVAARAALTTPPGMSAYVAAKGGVAAFTQSLAAEVVTDGILVNAVLPGIIDTPANRAAMPKADFSSWATPTGIAASIAFLASPDNTVTSGALVPVYGRS